MRTIKFKCWDKELNRFVIYEPHISIDLNGNIYNLQNGEGRDRYDLVQFTGLLDRRGKEIYEGDIVKTDARQGNMKVIYFDAYASFMLEIDGLLYPLNEGADIEVIGNIYENPDLLNNQK